MSSDVVYMAAMRGMPSACVLAGAQKHTDTTSGRDIRLQSRGKRLVRYEGGRARKNARTVKDEQRAMLTKTLKMTVAVSRVCRECEANAVQNVDLRSALLHFACLGQRTR